MFQPLLVFTMPDIQVSIKGRLKELGWTETDMSQCGYDLTQLPEVRKLEPLTPIGKSVITQHETKIIQSFQNGSRYATKSLAGCRWSKKDRSVTTE